MSLCGRLETDVETNVPAEKIHGVFSSSTLGQTSCMSPDKVHGVDLLKGEWGEAGCVIRWRFKFDGVSKNTKTEVEIDNVNLSTTFKVIEGDLTEAYKSLNVTYKAIPKGQGSIVHVTLTYEKLSENIPAPTAFYNYIVDFAKDINAYLTQAQT